MTSMCRNQKQADGNSFLIVFAIALSLRLTAAAGAAAVDFVREVRPIFEKHCYDCHGPAKQKSGLRLDIKSEAFKGGDAYGPSIVAGNDKISPLMKLVRSDDEDMRMPPKGERLSAAEIGTLATWINEGATWPDGVDLAKLDDPLNHWSFQPVRQLVSPNTSESDWPRNEIDRFILARLHREGLRPSIEANRSEWLRRVYFDLTGMPPSPEDMAAFVEDQGSDAYERVVDRLTSSPRYGERWAQHWLDVVRYADTHGFEVNTERPNAWPYRDYVIKAFNRDTPYDRFIREQVIGDALGEDPATGFLVTASVLLPGQIGKDEPSKRLARQDALDEIVVNTGQTFLGLSIGCARCHDHKFDPISQHDYYSMQAFFAGVEYSDRELHTPDAEALREEEKRLEQQSLEIERELARFTPLVKSGAERPAVNARANTDRFAPTKAKHLRFTIKATNNREPCIDELEVFDTAGVNVALASQGARATSSGDTTVADRHDLRYVNDGRFGNSSSWMSSEVGKGWVVLEFAGEHTIDRVVWGRDRDAKFTDRLATDYRIEVADASGEWRAMADSTDRRKYVPSDKKPMAFSTSGLSEGEAQEATRLVKVQLALAERRRAAEVGQKAFAGAFRTPDKIHLLSRGDPEQPMEQVAPAVPGALGKLVLPKDAAELERRRSLADWIASPDNPLTARVMVNRVWHGHFGAGLVDTPSDFGRNGGTPSHQELLDWLASEFIRSGWSIKHMHRQIVLSATYRQSGRIDSAAQAKDADVRLLWRFPSRRLDAEAIRDAMLAASGRLDLTMSGPGFDLFDKRGGLTGFIPIESFGKSGLRRMIYAHKVRRERDAVFGAFDCPDAGQSTARRRESTTPIQSLNLFNSRFTIDEADAFAARLQADAGDEMTNQMRRAYQLAVSRAPTADELHDAEVVVREHGLATLSRALFNSNEFLFLP